MNLNPLVKTKCQVKDNKVKTRKSDQYPNSYKQCKIDGHIRTQGHTWGGIKDFVRRLLYHFIGRSNFDYMKKGITEQMTGLTGDAYSPYPTSGIFRFPCLSYSLISII